MHVRRATYPRNPRLVSGRSTDGTWPCTDDSYSRSVLGDLNIHHLVNDNHH
jgi:hypothetical protein